MNKVTELILKHFKVHWWKWSIFVLTAGIALSGYKCQTKKFTFEKSPVRIKKLDGVTK